MKRKEEPAEALLTRKPAEETCLLKEGFLSALYVPEADIYPGKAMILVGGSDGYFSLTKLIAEQYAGRGLTILALAYWAAEGLPTAMSRIPLEYAEKAALWLRDRGYEKIGMMGISMGAEYTLLCASYLPELISCTVAINPICICSQGIQKKNQWHKKMQLLPGSAFSFRGKDLPYGKLTFQKGSILRDSLRRKEICLRSCYEKAVETAGEDTMIPAEKISGAVLLLAAEQDAMWPSAESAEKLIKQREIHGLKTEYCHYTYASHFLLPYRLKSRRIFAVERKYPDECEKSNLEAFQKILAFLRINW